MAYIIDDIVNAIGAAVASQQQQYAADQAMKQWKPIWQADQDNFNPYLNAGKQALGSLTDLSRAGPGQLSPDQLQNDPGYQFQLQEGQKALQRSAAAKGMLNSGATLKGLDRYSQGLASTQYSQAWSRNRQDYQQRFNNYANLANMGMGAANQLGNFGNQYGTAISNLLGAKGNAAAAGTIGMTNAASQAVRDVGSLAMTMAGGGGGMMGGMMGGLMGGGGGGGGASTGYIPSQAALGMGGG